MDQDYIDSMWERAVSTLEGAKTNLDRYPDIAANRAYYAAFFAVSALFAIDGTYFKRHSGLRSAVHKELVHSGQWPKELGGDYDKLIELRETADYGAVLHASAEEAAEAIARAKRILRAVREARPDIFR